MLPALMHPTQVARPFHTKGWIYEEKIVTSNVDHGVLIRTRVGGTGLEGSK
jgi:hypothetical protein